MKNEKGITLIALIITIIVMLILVAVTVNVAINGGLFGEANKAATGTEEEAIYDQIVSAMVLDKDGKLNVSSTANSAIADLKGKGYTVSPEEITEGTKQVTLEVTGKKGTYKYTITGEEIKIEGEESGGKDEDIQHPTIAEGSVWDNVYLADELSLPTGDDYKYWYLQLDDSGNSCVGFSPYMLSVDDGLSYLFISVNDFAYIYAFSEIHFYDVEMGQVDYEEGWNATPGAPDISTVKLSGTVQWTDGDKSWTVPDYFANWFIQK